MKKIICVLLSLMITISFTGCTNSTPVKELVSDFIKEVNNPLTEIDLSGLGRIALIDYTIDNDMVAILYTPFVTEGSLNDEDYSFKAYLTLYDINRKSLKEPIEVDADAFEIDLSDDTIQVWYSDNESELNESELYDLTLNQVGNGESEYVDVYKIAETIDTIDTTRFSCFESYAYDSNFINYEVIVFYDDKDNYYINERNTMINRLSSYEKIFLDCTQSQDNEVILDVKNFESMTLTNSITISDENGYCSIVDGAMDSKYAVFETLNEDGSTEKLYCWSYNDNAVNTPLNCTVVNDADFNNYVNTVCDRVNENYGVHIELSKSLPDEFIYKCVDNKTNAQYLLCLHDLEYCLSTFPKQMYHEMLCNDIDEATSKFQELNIYLVGEIDDGQIAGYANNINDNLVITYSCGDFTFSTFCHELMHDLEFRIEYFEPDFDEKWCELNPDDFSYTSEYSDAYLENDSYVDYFARDYGMSRSLEDRATVFEMYYDVCHSNSEPWWQEHEPLNDKVNYLNEVLSKSYPSLSKS